MIVTVQGTHKSFNHANELLAALSVMGYATEQKKTLILQFTNKSEKSVENLLIGKKLRNESLIADTSIPDVSVGMDPLVAKTRGYDSKIFSQTTKAMVSTKKTNLFDIAYVSRKESFEEELMSREMDIAEKDDEQAGIIESLLTAANEVYDIVYVLVPNDNQVLAKSILSYADISLICVYQGHAETYIKSDNVNVKEIIVIDDFELGSAYNGKVMAKIYGVPTVFGLFHNVGFKDACTDGVVLQWVNTQRKCQKHDPAYDLIHNLELLYNSIVGNKSKKKADVDFDELPKLAKETELIRTWEPANYDVVCVVKKTGLFVKKTDEKITLVPILNETESDAEPVNTDEIVDDAE